MKPSRMELFTKPAAPSDSWWLSQQTREAFTEAHARQLERMKRAKIQTGGEARVVGSVYGKP